MGFTYRKSKKIGPFRITASKSGISTSVGVKGARITRTANGRTTARVGIPGTGLGYTTSTSAKRRPAAASRAQSGALPPRPGDAVAPAFQFTSLSKAERRDLAAQATEEDKRAAWRGNRATLTPVQMAYRWQLNGKIMRRLLLPVLVLLVLVLVLL